MKFPDQVFQALVKKLKGTRKKRLPNPPRSRFPNQLLNEAEKDFSEPKFSVQDFVAQISELILKYSKNVPQIKTDAFEDDIEFLVDKLNLAVSATLSDAEIKERVKRYADKGLSFSETQIKNQFQKVLGITPFLNEPYLKNMVSNYINSNVDLITSVREENKSKMSRLVRTAVSEGTLNKEFAKEIAKKFGDDISEVTKSLQSRARLIARDQISKFQGQITQARQQNLGVTQYVWRTSGDNRVRPEHAKLNGKIFSWDEPPAVGHPGEDFQCRCVAEPILSSSAKFEGTELGDFLNNENS
jgi:SPP1 gp7 family putative phage head morphogenesis protein